MLKALPQSWKTFLGEKGTERLNELETFLARERAAGKEIYPSEENIFRAFQLTNPDDVKVVILGQDPYHGENQAHGLSFSVQEGVSLPPSLRNIFKELTKDLEPHGFKAPKNGDLTKWAKQGVLLLNAVLTVEAGQAGSHARRGWEEFTDAVIESLGQKNKGVVFILWGNYAIKKRPLIDESNHCVLTSVHPSPLSASRGFLGSQPFSNANKYLQSIGKNPIDWLL